MSEVMVSEMRPEQRIKAAYDAARERHRYVEGVAYFLDKKLQTFRGQWGSFQRVLDNQMHPYPQETAAAQEGKQKLFEATEALFSEWRDMPSDVAARQILVADLHVPTPLSAEQIYEQTLMGLRKHVGIVFELAGDHLTARPASRLDANQRDFIKRNRVAIADQIRREQDIWVVK